MIVKFFNRHFINLRSRLKYQKFTFNMTSSNPKIVGIEKANENMLDIGEGMKLWVIIYIDYNFPYIRTDHTL